MIWNKAAELILKSTHVKQGNVSAPSQARSADTHFQHTLEKCTPASFDVFISVELQHRSRIHLMLAQVKWD